MGRDSKRVFALGLIFIFSSIFIGGAYALGAFDTFQSQIQDRFFVKKEAPRDIIIFAIDDESIREIGAWPWPRAIFADLLRALDRAAAIGIDVNFAEPSRFGEADDAALEKALRAATPFVVLPIQKEAKSGLLLKPLERFAELATLGLTNVALDADGTARTTESMPSGVPLFGVQLATRDLSQAPSYIRVAYFGPARTITTIPVIDVLDGSLPARFIQDKTVLVGATAADLQDFVETPFGRMSGVEYHANVLATFADGAFFNETPRALGLLLITAVNALAVTLIFFVRTFARLLLSLGVLGLLIGISSIVLFGVETVVPVLYLLLGFLITSGVGILFQYITESREKQFIRKSFQYYLAPDVVEEISRNPKKLSLGGEERRLTILFSDIRGFTTIAESLTPSELMDKLNVYFTLMSDIVMERRGLVDKYIGDALMAFWGAPLENKGHAKDAARAAVLMMERLNALNAKWEKEGEPPFHIGIGLSTGNVVVGNMGSEKRFNYTIIGDEVNFAARLEGLTKTYGVSCLMGEVTRNEISNEPEFRTRELDLVLVKGKSEPRKVFQLVTKKMDDVGEKIFKEFEKGRVAYMNGEWERAISAFEKALSIGDDGPGRALLERAQALKKNPPKDWNGVFEFTTK